LQRNGGTADGLKLSGGEEVEMGNDTTVKGDKK
jgi:hypothetical protein